MRVVCRESRTPYLVETLRKDTVFMHLTSGVAPGDVTFEELLKHLSELSERIVKNSSSPKK